MVVFSHLLYMMHGYGHHTEVCTAKTLSSREVLNGIKAQKVGMVL